MSNHIHGSEIDAMAGRLARNIMQMPDKDRSEYVAVVYRDESGQLKSTDLHTSGSHAGAPLSDAVAQTPGYASIVAIVHNHPIALVTESPYRELSMEIEKLPSNNDWNIARKKFEGRTDVTHYVLGPDDHFRKYPFSEIDHWDRLNDPPRIDHFQRRFKAGEEVDIPQTLPADEPAPDTKPVARNPQALLTEPGHADHSLYQQAHALLQRFDADNGYQRSDLQREQLAAALTVRAKDQGFEQMHHIIGINDGARLFAIDLPDSKSLFRRTAHVDVAEAQEQSLATTHDGLARVDARLAQHAIDFAPRSPHDPNRGGPVMS